LGFLAIISCCGGEGKQGEGINKPRPFVLQSVVFVSVGDIGGEKATGKKDNPSHRKGLLFNIIKYD